jgi:hypothetical protein
MNGYQLAFDVSFIEPFLSYKLNVVKLISYR